MFVTNREVDSSKGFSLLLFLCAAETYSLVELLLRDASAVPVPAPLARFALQAFLAQRLFALVRLLGGLLGYQSATPLAVAQMHGQILACPPPYIPYLASCAECK